MSILQILQSDVAAWSAKTFPNQTVESKMKHLIKEANEVIEHPYDIVEFADCLLLLIGAAYLSGFSAEQLIDAGFKKLEVCKTRQWGQPDAEGVCQHVDDKSIEPTCETKRQIEAKLISDPRLRE